MIELSVSLNCRKVPCDGGPFSVALPLLGRDCGAAHHEVRHASVGALPGQYRQLEHRNAVPTAVFGTWRAEGGEACSCDRKR